MGYHHCVITLIIFEHEEKKKAHHQNAYRIHSQETAPGRITFQKTCDCKLILFKNCIQLCIEYCENKAAVFTIQEYVAYYSEMEMSSKQETILTDSNVLQRLLVRNSLEPN